jgi:hypothetical protein
MLYAPLRTLEEIRMNVTKWPVDIPRRQAAPVELESWELPHATRQAADEKLQHAAYMARQCCAYTEDPRPVPTWAERIANRLDARAGLALLFVSSVLVLACGAAVVWVAS